MNLEIFSFSAPSRSHFFDANSYNKMTCNIATALSGAIVMILTMGTDRIVSAAAQAGLVQELSEWSWATFPFVGSILAGITSILFRNDSWKANLARFIGTIVLGVVTARILIYVHPSLKFLVTDQVLLTGMGYLFGMVWFIMIHALFWFVAQRGPDIGKDFAEGFLHRKLKNLREIGDKEDPKP